MIISQKPQQEGRRGFAQMLSKSLHHPQITAKGQNREDCSAALSLAHRRPCSSAWLVSRALPAMGGVGSGPQMAPQELYAMQHCPPQACPPLAPSQSSHVTAQPSLRTREGLPGGPLDPLPSCPDLSSAQRLGHEAKAVLHGLCSVETVRRHSGSLIMSPAMAAAPF